MASADIRNSTGMLGRAINSAEFMTSRMEQRVRKIVGSTTTKYIYAGSEMLFTTDGNNAKITENVLSINGQVIASQRFNDNYEGNYYFYNQDIRNSTMSIVSESYTGVKYYTYNEYGKIGVSGYSSFINSETYTGAVTEGSNIYYMNARFYDANNGRFLTQDTYKGNAWEPMSQNLYTYVGNNPINYIDPTGHSEKGVGSNGVQDYIYNKPAGSATEYEMQQLLEEANKAYMETIYGDDAALYTKLIDDYVRKMGKLAIYEDRVNQWTDTLNAIDTKMNESIDRFYDRNGMDLLIDYGTLSLFSIGGFAVPDFWIDAEQAFYNSGGDYLYLSLDKFGTQAIVEYEFLNVVAMEISLGITQAWITNLQNKYYYPYMEEYYKDLIED